MAIFLLVIFHIIEWFRVIFILIKILLGQNFIPLYYICYFNSAFGIAVYIYVHVARYGTAGMNCADAQPLRAKLLMAEVIIFWTTFILHTFPQLFMICMTPRKLALDVTDEPNNDDEESEGEEAEK